MPDPVVIATWPFGKRGVEVALPLLAKGDPALDVALAAAQAVEDDIGNRTSVGFGSLADALGRLTLDACVMDGRTLACGAVAALEHIRHPAAVARRVMEKTPHVLLAGEGAQWFAIQQGFPLEMPHTAESVRGWFDKHPANRKKDGKQPTSLTIDEADHDTVTVLARDAKGHLGGVCTTSGLAHKMHGRVGDSPLIGSALYVDDEVGAAGATGVGEEIIRIGGASFLMEQMRAGKSPQEACEIACKRVHAAAARRGVHTASVAFIALDPKGTIGGACTPRTNFTYAVGRGNKVEMITAKEVNA